MNRQLGIGDRRSGIRPRHPTPDTRHPDHAANSHPIFCIGCGVCAGVCPSRRLAMQFNPDGEYRPVIGELVHRRTWFSEEPETINGERRTTNECRGCGSCSKVCPSRSGNPNEDQLAEAAFASIRGIRHTSAGGYYLACHAGHIQSNEDRLQRSSGGLTTWLLKSLLERNVVTRVAQVETAETAYGLRLAACSPDSGPSAVSRQPSAVRRPIFIYSLAGDVDAVARAAKSAYYPVEISSVIREIIATPGRYAIAGLPCFLKAIRQAMQCTVQLRERVAVLIGLVCGGTRSLSYADYLCALTGGEPSLMEGADFRVKDPQRPTWDYGFKAEMQDRNPSSSFGLRHSGLRFRTEAWTRRYFEPEACSYCDDVFAEVADVVFMDAWLDRYMSEPSGANLVLVRRPDIGQILEAGARTGEIHLEDVTIQDVERSQQATIDLRRTALAERLGLARQMGWAVPTKRVAPVRVSPYRQVQLLLERAVRRTSRSAFRLDVASGKRSAALREFRRRMRPSIFALKALNYVQARIAVVRRNGLPARSRLLLYPSAVKRRLAPVKDRRTA